MAEKQDANQEPSIEEILDSIRQIISDDDEAGSGAAPAESEAESDSDDGDVVELTEKVEEPTAEPAAIEIDMQESPEPEPAPPAPPSPPPPPEPKPVAAPPPPPPAPKENPELPSGDSDSILTEKAENAAMEAFTDLARRAAVETSGQVTIEDLVRQEMRPMLRAWMDKHLPSMVERLVQKELERISRQVEGD